MKKTSAILAGLQTLAIATTLVAGTAVAATNDNTADTNTTTKISKKSGKKAKHAKATKNAKAANAQATKTVAEVKPTADTIQSSAAAPVEPTAASASSTTTLGNTLKDRLVAFDYSVYSGGAPFNWNAQTPDNLDLSTDQQNIDNAVTVGYKINPTTYIGAQINFLYTPVMGQDIKLEDPAIKIADTALYKRGNLSLYADARYYVPVTTPSQDAHRVAYLRTVEALNYDIPNTRWSIGSYASIRHYIYSDNDYSLDATTGMDTLVKSPKMRTRAYIGPYVQYQITPKVAFFGLCDLEAVNYYGTSYTSWSPLGFDLEPGISWDITSKINLNPFINIYPGAGSTSAMKDSMYIGANLLLKFI